MMVTNSHFMDTALILGDKIVLVKSKIKLASL